MSRKDEWKYLRRVGWRSGLGDDDDEIKQVVYKDGPRAISFLKGIIENDAENNTQNRYEAMGWLISLSREKDFDGKAAIEMLKNVVNSTLDLTWSLPRQDALMALAHLVRSPQFGDDAMDFLLELATKPDSSREVRKDVLSALAETRSPKAVSALALGIIKGGGHRLVQSLQEIHEVSWTDKAKTFIDLIEKNRFRSSEVAADAVVSALNPSQGEAENPIRRLAEMGDFFIAESRNRTELVAGVLARLLIASEGGDQVQAGYRINEYQKDHQVPARELEGLRKAVGGTPALSGVMGVLQRDLETYFQKPIHELNEHTRKSWSKAVKSAHYGLVMRLWMSGTVFVVGIVLIFLSSLRMLFGDGSNGVDTQTLIPFAAGLGTMLLIIYSGPLKEIRQAVTDLATASAAFIAYVHRVLETSHTFSYYYLQQKISFEHMKQSSAIIKEAMINTIDALNREALDSSERTIIKAITKAIPKSLKKLNIAGLVKDKMHGSSTTD